jgi:serine/threonine protein kinase
MAKEANGEKDVFLAALELADPAARDSFLDTACAGDTALRQRVAALIEAHEQADSILDQVPTQGQSPAPQARDYASADASAPRERPPSQTTLANTAAIDEEGLSCLAPSTEPGSLGRLDYYEALDVAGRGGMGIVLKARDTKLQRIVAIKVLLPALAASATGRKRFVREARAAAAVRDDHVVAIYAVSDQEPVPYLVMEYITGVTLQDKIAASGPLDVKEILRIGMQAARGLAAAHAQGLIHRDIKPRNILLENGVQRVKITDFGLARPVDDEDTLSQAGMIAGTPLYMAPEQTRGEPLDPRTDLFSLGSVLYTMCTGSPAFRAGTGMAVLIRVCTETPRPIHECNPDIPDWLCAIVARLQAKDPAQRFQSATEVADLLELHLACLQQPGAQQPHHKRPPLVTAPSRRVLWSLRWIVAAAALAGIVGLIGALLWRPPSDPVPNGEKPVVAQPDTRPQQHPKVVSYINPGGANLYVDPARAVKDIVDYKELVGAGAEELREWQAGLAPQFRMMLVSGRLGRGPNLFNAVAVMEKSPVSARFTLQVPVAEGQKTFDDYGSQGFRPVAVCYHTSADKEGGTVETGVWVSDKQGCYARNKPLKGLRTEMDQAKADESTRLIDVGVIGERDNSLFCTLEAHPDRSWDVLYALSPMELLSTVASYKTDGWRPDLIVPHLERGDLRFLFVAVSNADRVDWHFRMDMTLDEYRTESAQQKRRGLMPIGLRSYGDDDAVRYAAVWVRYIRP